MSHSKLNLKRGRREEPTANKILDGKKYTRREHDCTRKIKQDTSSANQNQIYFYLLIINNKNGNLKIIPFITASKT